MEEKPRQIGASSSDTLDNQHSRINDGGEGEGGGRRRGRGRGREGRRRILCGSSEPAVVLPGQMTVEGDDGSDGILARPEDYIFKGLKRLVRPYFFDFRAHAKRRWDGKSIVDLFASEFTQRPYEYYVEAVRQGRLRVDGRIVNPSVIVRDSQTISHFVHRHEPPVLAYPIKILTLTADVVTVFKPATVPVHSCGQYRKNTVMGILEAEHNLGTLFPIHRLDRLVSGLLIFARNSTAAERFRQDVQGGHVQKEYVARVMGVFPEEEIEVNASVLYDPKEGHSIVEKGRGDDGEKNCQKRKEEILLNGGKSKEACTRFKRQSTDGVTSIVACKPLTGRTHQIRVHLQYLGHPIANDALYLRTELNNPLRKRSHARTTADAAAKAVFAEQAFVIETALSDKGRHSNAGCASMERVGDHSPKEEGALRVGHGEGKYGEADRIAAMRQTMRTSAPSLLATRPLKEEVAVALHGMESTCSETQPGERDKDDVDASGPLEERVRSCHADVAADVSGDCLRNTGSQGGLRVPETILSNDLAQNPTPNADNLDDEKDRRNGESDRAGVSSEKVLQEERQGLTIGEGVVRVGEEREEDDDVVFEFDPLCTHCPSLLPLGYEEELDGLWLHCSRYAGPSWAYECPLPEWALIMTDLKS